ncbi:YtxH domain-containing protein [Pedobacter sp. PWIIR3]
MKFKKLAASIIAHKNNNGEVAVAVIAGLAIGAALAVLLAPERGEDFREGIAGKARGFGSNLRDELASLKKRISGEEVEEETVEEIPHYQQTTVKKPKSDIKDLIHEAHTSAHHTEHSIG